MVEGCLRDKGVEEVSTETSTGGAFSRGENEFISSVITRAWSVLVPINHFPRHYEIYDIFLQIAMVFISFFAHLD